MEKRYLQREGKEEKDKIKHRYRKAIAEITDYHFGENVLDAGCGQGYGMEVLRQKGFNVVGIDASLNAYEQYIKESKQEGIFLIGDVEKTQFLNNSFKYIFAVEILEHLNKTQALGFLEEAHRLLKENGQLVIIMPQRRLAVEEYPSGCHYIEYNLPEFLKVTNGMNFGKFKLIKYIDKNQIDKRSDLYIFKKE